MSTDAETPLSPGSTNFTQLSAMLKLMNLKTLGKLSLYASHNFLFIFPYLAFLMMIIHNLPCCGLYF